MAGIKNFKFGDSNNGAIKFWRDLNLAVRCMHYKLCKGANGSILLVNFFSLLCDHQIIPCQICRLNSIFYELFMISFTQVELLCESVYGAGVDMLIGRGLWCADREFDRSTAMKQVR